MENRSEHTQPEEQGWGAYATPPRYTGQHTPSSDAQVQFRLCAQVVERLPSLLENDGEIAPEMAAALYSHLSLCAQCAREFDEMQRVVAMVEALAPIEMPMDFSGIIMQRIQTEIGPLRSDATPRPTVAASSTLSGEAARNAAERQSGSHERIAAFLQETEAKRLHADAAHAGLHLDSLTQTRANGLERITMAAILVAFVAFCLSSTWGRQMLGVNLESAGAWLMQVRAAVERVPLLGSMAGFIFAALTQVGSLIVETYRNLGTMAAKGLVVDIGLIAVAYYVFFARRQRQRMHGI